MRGVIICLLLVLASCTTYDAENQASVVRTNINEIFIVEKVTDANFPIDFAFAPDGSLFFIELNSGYIKILEDNRLAEFTKVPDHLIPAVPEGEAGLLSMTLDPSYPDNGYVYVYYSSNGTNKIARYTVNDNQATNFTIIFDGIPQGKIHNGGDLEFGSDGTLYLSTGDATPVEVDLGSANPAQNLSSYAGKILRINAEGSLPEDNPIPGSFTYAYGLRNVFGFAFDSEGKLFAADHGVECCDEINIIVAGANYGWPFETGRTKDSPYIQPIFAWEAEDRVAPTGMTFYDGEAYGEAVSNIFMGTWRTRELYQFTIEENTITAVTIYTIDALNEPSITGMHASYTHEGEHPLQGILEVSKGPDNLIYISDATGIYRLLPKN